MWVIVKRCNTVLRQCYELDVGIWLRGERDNVLCRM